MNSDETFNALDFDNNTVLDHEVGSMLADLVSFVEHGNAYLPHVAEASCGELDAEGLLVV
jgi:hypothetical protein